MSFHRIALLASLVLLFSPALIGQALPALPQDPMALIALAHDKNGLVGPDIKPWHIRATYHSFDKKGHPEFEGTYEEWWVSPARYKLSFTSPKATQTDYATGAALLREGSQEWPAGFELLLRGSLIEPLPEASMLKDFKLQSHLAEAGKVRLPCVEMTYPVRGNVQVSRDFFPGACFEPTIPVLRIFSHGSARVVYDRTVLFQNHYVAHQVQVYLNGKLVADMNVDVIEALKEPADTIVAPPSSALLVDLATITLKEATRNQWPMLLKKAFPVYPDQARMNRVQGTVNIRAVIEPDGHIDDVQIIDGPDVLRPAATDAVRQWLYRPFDVMGEPRPVHVKLHVIFQMG